jgi:ABC-type phosphate/phosphonate transport system substrate-binding protein
MYPNLVFSRSRLLALGIVAGLIGLLVSASILRAEPVARLVIGVQTSQTSRELNERYANTAQRLRDRIREATGNTVEVRFVPLASQQAAITALTKGQLDVVALEPTGFVSAVKSQPHVTLLCEQREGGREVRGAIIVHGENNAKSLPELAGQTVAFGPKYAATTGLIAQAEFVRSAVRRYDVLPVVGIDRNQVLAGVRAGDFAAGAIDYTTNFEATGIRVLCRYQSLGTLWASRVEVDAMTNLAIQNALLQDPDFCIVNENELTTFRDSFNLGLKFDN